MVEESSINLSVGHYRLKYLDLANMFFTREDVDRTRYHIDNFLDTIDPKSKSGIELKSGLDDIYAKKAEDINKFKKETEGLRFLEGKDTFVQGKSEIEMNALHDIKEICWRIAMRDGLFHE